MGVFLSEITLDSSVIRLPHARGGVSDVKTVPCLHDLSSPRTWGCFWAATYPVDGQRVFPTHVGVFLFYDGPDGPKSSLPHARGGVSERKS